MFGWEFYPLININSNPRILSKIIIHYLEDGKDKKETKSLPIKEYRTKNNYIFPLKGNWVLFPQCIYTTGHLL